MSFPNDMSRIAGALGKIEASSDQYTAHPRTAARNMIRRTYRIDTTSKLVNGDDAVAANAAPAVRMARAGRVLGAYVLPRVAATANATNYCTLSVKPIIAGVAGNACASIATTVLAGGNMVVGTTYSLTVDTAANNDRYAAGTWLAAVEAMTAAGVAVGAASWSIDVEEEDVDGYGS